MGGMNPSKVAVSVGRVAKVVNSGIADKELLRDEEDDSEDLNQD